MHETAAAAFILYLANDDADDDDADGLRRVENTLASSSYLHLYARKRILARVRQHIFSVCVDFPLRRLRTSERTNERANAKPPANAAAADAHNLLEHTERRTSTECDDFGMEQGESCQLLMPTDLRVSSIEPDIHSTSDLIISKNSSIRNYILICRTFCIARHLSVC